MPPNSVPSFSFPILLPKESARLNTGTAVLSAPRYLPVGLWPVAENPAISTGGKSRRSLLSIPQNVQSTGIPFLRKASIILRVGSTAFRPPTALGVSSGWRKKFCISIMMSAERKGSIIARFRDPVMGIVTGLVVGATIDRVRSYVSFPR